MHDAAIDASTHEAALQQVVEQIAVLSLLTLNHRREQQELRSLFQPSDAVDDLLRRLSRDGPAALRAVTLSDSREEHSKVVENFRDRPDGRTRVAAGRLLLNRNRRRESGDRIDLRLRHLAEELPSVTRQRFDVAALSFGVQRVKGQ